MPSSRHILEHFNVAKLRGPFAYINKTVRLTDTVLYVFILYSFIVLSVLLY